MRPLLRVLRGSAWFNSWMPGPRPGMTVCAGRFPRCPELLSCRHGRAAGNQQTWPGGMMRDKAGYNDMRRLVGGYATSIAVSVVAELGIPDLLAGGPLSVAELARRVGAHEDFLRRVLRYLASEGVFAAEPE